MATAEPTELRCENGVCSAQFTAFCLQEHRDIPKPGTAYKAAENSPLKLVVTDRSGRKRSVLLGDHVVIRTERTFVAVRLSVPEAIIKSFGGVTAAISVAPSSSLLPVPVAGDLNPQTVTETADFTGPHRGTAQRVLASRHASAELVSRTARLINALPVKGDAPKSLRDKLWKQVFGSEPATVTGRGAVLAREAFEDCRRDINSYLMDGMRSCLTRYHDDAMITTTHEIWKAIKTGS
ncbi:MAG: hypothetical protein O3A84_03975 [Proteobacteria bacterium]|nr:hypothetical protein [Pseudomonadota bacterium]